jgi:hypothetical protein
MSNFLMAVYTFGIGDTIKIVVVNFFILRGCFQVAMAGETARIINIFFVLKT